MPEIKSSDPYGCHNRPEIKTHVSMQDGTEYHGWQVHNGMTATGNRRIQAYKLVEHRMSTTCQYDKSGSDPRCSGCKHHNPDNAAKYADKNDGGVLAWLIPGWTPELWAEFKEWRKNK